MAYASSTFSDQDDLATILNSYATGLSDAWSSDLLDTSGNVLAIHKSSCYVQLTWDGSDLRVYQSLGYDSSAPGSNPNDSGVGASRLVTGIGDGGGTYFFFHVDSSPVRYIHAVVKYAAGLYRHFGFGHLDERPGDADFTGGEYAYGHTWNQSVGSKDTPLGAHSVLLDSNCNSSTIAATLHVEGLQNQPASGKWALLGNISSLGNDGDGNGRCLCFGGARSGPYTSQFCIFQPSHLTGLVPMAENHVFYKNTTPSPDRWVHLGIQPDVRILNIKNFEPEDEIPVGSDVWKIFPMVRKQKLDADTEESWNMGVAYRKS